MLKFFSRTRASARRQSVALGVVPVVLGLALVAAASSTAFAQSSSVPVTPTEKFFAHFDLGVEGMGSLTSNTSGNITVPTSNNYGGYLTDSPSTTVGYLLNVSYTKSPYFGIEFNYNYARYTENYTYPVATGVASAPFTYRPLGVQTNAKEYTLGYVAHIPHEIAGLKPFVGAGAGSIGFKPTPNGGEGFNTQARMAYFYELGVNKPLGEHFGLRVEFRQVFFLAPDFGQNYLTNIQHTNTVEPAAGFYIHF